MERGKVITGARSKLLIEGKPIGWATDITVTEGIDYGESIVLGSIEVQEHVPNIYRVRLQFGTLTISGKSLKQQNIFPKCGTTESDRLRNIINTGEMVVAVLDDHTNAIMHVVTGVKLSEQTITIQAGNISGTSVTAVARTLKDASEL